MACLQCRNSVTGIVIALVHTKKRLVSSINSKCLSWSIKGGLLLHHGWRPQGSVSQARRVNVSEDAHQQYRNAFRENSGMLKGGSAAVSRESA